MGAKRWYLIALCVALYLLPIHICPWPSPDFFDPICLTAIHDSAGVIYKLYSTPWMFLVVLAAFHATPDRATRRRIALWVAALFLPIALAMHWPYFLWASFTYQHPEPTIMNENIIACGFLLWLLSHRLLARWRLIWDRLDPSGIVPLSDRRRAIFWHPATALLFHHLAASTDLWVLTWP